MASRLRSSPPGRSESKNGGAHVARGGAAVDELRASGAPSRVLEPGVVALRFALPNAEELIVDSTGLLVRGPLIVTFYRGRW